MTAARASLLHRLPAGPKLAALAAAGTLAFLVTDWRWLAFGALAVAALHAFARIPLASALAPLRAAALILTFVLLAQGLSGDWRAGALAVLQIATLIALASLVSLTTRQSDMTDALARGLRPLRHIGLDPDMVALGLSLAVRFIPLIAAEAALIRDAQRARGREGNPLALFVPLIVRILKMADDLSEAIDARSG